MSNTKNVYRLNRYRPFICTCIGTSFIAAILSIEAILVIHFVASNDSNNFDNYSPNDTRTIPYNYQLCQGLTLTSEYSTTFFPSASLFLLNAAPHLNGSQRSIVTESVNLNEEMNNVTWAVNMYNGSNMSISIYGDPSHPVILYLIKGKQNYTNWNTNPDVKYSIQHVKISDSTINNLTYSVSVNDIYYLVVYQHNTTTGSNLNVTIDYYRTKYTYSPSSIAASCSIDLEQTSCTIWVPMSSRYTALMVLNDTDSWRDTITIGVNCDSRVWVFVMVTLVILLFFILLFNSLIIGCIYVRAFIRRRGSYVRIN